MVLFRLKKRLSRGLELPLGLTIPKLKEAVTSGMMTRDIEKFCMRLLRQKYSLATIETVKKKWKGKTPEFQKTEEGKWVPLIRKAKKDYQKIFVGGRRSSGQKLSDFNGGQVSKAALKAATVVTQELKELLAFLDYHIAVVGQPMPQIYQERPGGEFITIQEVPERGQHKVAAAASSTDANPYYYCKWPGIVGGVRQVKNASWLAGRIGFLAARHPQARITKRRMPRAEALAASAEAWETAEEHRVSCTPVGVLEVPVGWEEFLGTPIACLEAGGAVLTPQGISSETFQPYHLLEYPVATILCKMDGGGAHNIKGNSIQQLEAALRGTYYVKLNSMKPELCWAGGCWNVAFCSFYPMQSDSASGEGTFFKKLGRKEVVKVAIDEGRLSSVFKLLRPTSCSSTIALTGGRRKIRKQQEVSHSFSNKYMEHIPRVVVAGHLPEDVEDGRFLHQKNERTGITHRPFTSLAALKAQSLPLLCEFFTGARQVARDNGYHLPQINVDFEEVTRDLITNIGHYLDVDWASMSGPRKTAFLKRWQ